MKKIKIVIDFDNTVAQSNQAFIDIANEKTGSNARIGDIIDYHFDNIVPTWSRQQQNDVFISKEFYEKLKPFPMAIEVLKQLKDEGHELIICSITRAEGMLYKSEWIRKFLPFVDSTILIDNFKQGDATVNMNKSSIVGSVLIDDHISNLRSAEFVNWRILFGDNAYSKDWEGLKAMDWNGVYKLMQIISKTEK